MEFGSEDQFAEHVAEVERQPMWSPGLISENDFGSVRMSTPFGFQKTSNGKQIKASVPVGEELLVA